MPTFEVVGAEQLERLTDLQSLAEEVFGRKQRTPDWLIRKLERECVLPELSAIARTADGICGYVLVGRPPSLASVARGAGVGVLAPMRGRGIGRALIELACTRAWAAGCTSLEFLAEPERLAWYVGQGFVVLEAHATLAGRGLGERDDLATGATLASAPHAEPALWSWTPEAWARTPAHERAYVQLPTARAWLTREGRAVLLQRLELSDPQGLAASLLSLQRRLAKHTPLLLYPCPAAGPTAVALQQAGFTVVQESFVLRRTK